MNVNLLNEKYTGIAYIETSNLDGETNLKVRKALSVTAHAVNQEDVTVSLETIIDEKIIEKGKMF